MVSRGVSGSTCCSEETVTACDGGHRASHQQRLGWQHGALLEEGRRRALVLPSQEVSYDRERVTLIPSLVPTLPALRSAHLALEEAITKITYTRYVCELLNSPNTYVAASRSAIAAIAGCCSAGDFRCALFRVKCLHVRGRDFMDAHDAAMNGEAGGISRALSSLWSTNSEKDDTCVKWGLVSVCGRLIHSPCPW